MKAILKEYMNFELMSDALHKAWYRMDEQDLAAITMTSNVTTPNRN